ncbi:4,5-DOPA dioxygenase extradiol [Rufibacter sediminis]|uniref:4,5-DOPA dioxygenase extradiol n=1 Tax=Rufibacter sediminis TaxID=2762756 RepID=A0ABR6VQF8_9BACT|nr:4,5-DOPA dioxygenase extradiol [Rufibacter sediminis]MBC3539434.1 4,5-DOPA dioxygenase extradiol [Rufibacter sediminis]
MTTISAFRKFTEDLTSQDYTMPVLFIGHGSPMNGIEDNEFSQRWKKMAQEIPVPKAVLVVSAHWFTRGTRITSMDFPQTIHDFGGFPQELFAVQYPSPGDAALAKETAELITSTHVELDHDWGLDHGTWTIIRHMYPQANVPVLQLSIDYTKGPQYHYDLAKDLTALRKKGVLIVGSGNMVHNLRMVSWSMINGGGYDWTHTINEKFKALIQNRDHQPLINYQTLGKEALLAIPTVEHYLPLLYTLGLQGKDEETSFFNDKMVGGSLTMTSVKIGA